MMVGYQDFPVKEKWFVKRKTFTNEDSVQNVMCIITSGAICRTDIFDTVGYFLDKYFIDYVDNEFVYDCSLLVIGFV
uniref:CAZy families GT2 protein n=1 Tax=uncultured Dickeya sp. TaxID=741653 RepID=A0A060CLP6_9GAMM|nr:CAZy families GT2 protein [uncultured Dickeya sp.]